MEFPEFTARLMPDMPSYDFSKLEQLAAIALSSGSVVWNTSRSDHKAAMGYGTAIHEMWADELTTLIMTPTLNL